MAHFLITYQRIKYAIQRKNVAKIAKISTHAKINIALWQNFNILVKNYAQVFFSS
jgi:hypothetical protein